MALRILDGSTAQRRDGEGSLSGFLGSFSTLALMGFVAMWSASSGYGIRMNQGRVTLPSVRPSFFVPAIIVFFLSSQDSPEN